VDVVKGRREARVLVVGVGGLGSPLAIALATAGVGTIGIADDDEVALSNLHRQILFEEGDVGRPKLEAASRALRRFAPPSSDTSQGRESIQVIVHATRLLPHNAVELVRGYDLAVEGSDNFATKFLAADACSVAGVPVVHAAAVRWHGTVLAVGAHGRPCYRCLFEDLPRGNAPNCAEAGVMGPVVGIVAAWQANLALELLDGRKAEGTLVTFDGKTGELRRRSVRPRGSCELCGEQRRPFRLEASRYAAAEEEV
jgi:molybdopterin/thiamine biosynthesis adenylyltransferase